LFTVSCQELDSGSDSADTTASEASADISALYGTWDGTYTPDAAWDEDGSLPDPPFELGTPVEMHMELHPWSAESAAYGTITAGGLYPARVTSLALDGDQVSLIVITEATGLNDLVGTFALTLDGETLSGEDDRDPEVPSGWISSSGTVYLTRTAAWDPTASTDTTASVPAPPAAPSGGDGGDGGADVPDIEVVPDDVGPIVHALGRADNGGSTIIGVGDTVVVHFDYLPGTEIADIFCQSTSSVLLEPGEILASQDPVTDEYYTFQRTFEAMRSGDVDIVVRSQHADGTLYEHWRHSFEIVWRVIGD